MAAWGKKGGGGAGFESVLRWPAWALALLSIGSVFGPLPADWMRVTNWGLFLFGLLEAGVAMARGRRWAFFAYGAIAILFNPFRPFHFAARIWRLIYGLAGLWLAADHLPGRD